MASAPPVVGPTWASELQRYERERRYEVDPELLRVPARSATRADIAHAERRYDTVLQTYRDSNREQNQRSFEERERLKHLNAAADVQLRREHKYNLINHENRMEAIEPVKEFKGGRLHYPVSHQEYNIVSNLGHDVHHWAHPDERPRPQQRSPRRRFIPAHQVKDFSLISNRYLTNHEEKAMRDKTLGLLESSAKFARECVFDPVKARCPDPAREERARAAIDAREVEAHLRARHQLPPSYHGRESAAYDIVTHRVEDPEHLQIIDALGEERNHRYRTRHAADVLSKEQEALFEDANNAQKNAQVSHERHEEVTRRGYDIITNSRFGDGPKQQKKHPPYTMPRQDVWEKATNLEPDAAGPVWCTPGAVSSQTGSQSARVASHSSPAEQPMQHRQPQQEFHDTQQQLQQHLDLTQPPPHFSQRQDLPSSGSRARSARSSGTASARGKGNSSRGSASLTASSRYGATPLLTGSARSPPAADFGSTISPSQAYAEAAHSAAMAGVAPPPPTIPGETMGSVYARATRG